MVIGGTTLAGVAAASGAATGETQTQDAPNAGDSYEYPTMGNNSDAPVCTVYGGHNCPYTEDLVAEHFSEIIERFVEPGRLNLTFRALEYDYDGNPWISENGVMAGQAAEGVWEEDTERYWHFFAELWKHMPGDVNRDKLESIMNDAGVDNAGYIADNLENWDPDLRKTSDDAESEGVDYSPTLELKGDLGNRHNAVEWIEQRLDGDGGSSESSSQESESSQDQEDDSGSDGGGDEMVCPNEEDSSSSGTSDSQGDTSTSESSTSSERTC